MRSLLASLLLVPLISCGDSSSSGKAGGKNSGGSGGADAADDESGGEDEPLPLPDFDALADEYNEWCLAADEAKCACCIEALGEDGCPSACAESLCDIDGDGLALYFTETSDPAELACMLARASAWAFVYECEADTYNSMDCSTYERGSTSIEVYNECAVLSQEAQAAACDE